MIQMDDLTNMQYRQQNYVRSQKSTSQYRFVAICLTLIGLLHGIHCEIGNYFNSIENIVLFFFCVFLLIENNFKYLFMY